MFALAAGALGVASCATAYLQGQSALRGGIGMPKSGRDGE